MTITFPSLQDRPHVRTESNQQYHWLLLRRFPWCLKKTQGMFLVVLQMCHQAVLLVSFMSSTPSTSSNDQNPNKKYFHHDGRFLQKKEHKMPILVDRTECTILVTQFCNLLAFALSDKVTQLNYRSHSSRRLRARTSSTKTRRTSSGTSTTTTTTLSTTCGSNLSRSGNTSTRFTITSNHLLAFPWSDT